MARISKKLIWVVNYVIIQYAIQTCHGACRDEISVCSSMFSVKKQALGPSEEGICSLAKSFVACVTALKPGCDTAGQNNIDRGVQGITHTYEGIKYNCTLDIDETDIARACMTHFDTCRSLQSSTKPCGYLALYKTCLLSTQTYCSSESTNNASTFITQTALNLTQTYACHFDRTAHTTAIVEPVVDHWLERKIAQTAAGSIGRETTTAPLITGNACFELFNNCKASKLTIVPSDTCLAVPVYKDCLENTTKVLCDVQSYSVVQRYVDSVISDCGKTTLSTSTLTTTGLNLVNGTSVTSETTSPVFSVERATTTKKIYDVLVSQSSKKSGDLFLDFGDSASSMTSLELVVIIAMATLTTFIN